MRHYILLSLIVVTGLFASCSSSKKMKEDKTVKGITPNGIEYKLLKDAPGTQNPKEGDYVQLFIKTFAKDSLVFDSRKQNNNIPVTFPVKKPTFHGDLMEAIMLMTPGDSGIFWVAVDSLKAAGQQLQPWMQEGMKIRYAIELVGVKSYEEIKKAQDSMQAKLAEEQKEIPARDEKLLQEYFKKNNLNPVKLESGLYYIITKSSNDEKVIPGQTVRVNYTGKLMDGTVFDSNQDPKFNHMEPFQFVLGRGQVIQGWDEGVAKMKVGEKATLFIPSRLAYGKGSPSPSIPPNSILIFDVELL